MPDLGFTAQQGAPESLMVSIVEDDPRIRQLIEEEVIDEGHSTRCFGTAEEFLKVTSEIQFDLVLLDLMLPGMDGLDCLEAMNQQPKSKPCKVVIVTALNDPEKRRKALNMGAMDYIMKPYIFESLSEILNKVTSKTSST